MTPSTPRTIAPPLIFARPSSPIFTKARGHNVFARAGLAYERKVGKALEALARGTDLKVERNPWFTFRDASGDGACSPDAILTLDDFTIVVEVKLKYVLGAEAKLKYLYLPIVTAARALPPGNVYPLIITKVLTPDAAALTVEGVEEAMWRYRPQRAPILHWLGNKDDRILWDAKHDTGHRLVTADSIAI